MWVREREREREREMERERKREDERERETQVKVNRDSVLLQFFLFSQAIHPRAQLQKLSVHTRNNSWHAMTLIHLGQLNEIHIDFKTT